MVQFGFYIIFFISVQGVACFFEWADDFKDGQTIHACEGHTVTFPWSYTHTPDPRGKGSNKHWTFSPTPSDRDMMATYSFGTFNADPKYANRVSQISRDSAGIVLKNLTLADSGKYSVSVIVLGSNVSSERTATLKVSDKLPVKDGQLKMIQLSDAELNDVVKDNQASEWHVALGCGQFTCPDRPPFDVQWKMPSGTEVNQSDLYQNGRYILLIHTPTEEGKYECHVPEKDRKEACLAPDDVNIFTASFRLGLTHSRWPRSSPESCEGRCALFTLKEDKPVCQCDGLCWHFEDCCEDYTQHCLVPSSMKKSTELGKWVGVIVGCVFVVVIVLAVIYFMAIRRKETRRMSMAGSTAAFAFQTGVAGFNIRPSAVRPQQ